MSKHADHKCLCPVCRKANKKAAKLNKILKKLDSQFVTEAELPTLIAQYLASNPIPPVIPPSPATPMPANQLLVSWQGSLALTAGTTYVPSDVFTLVEDTNNSNGAITFNAATGTITVNTPGMYMFTLSCDPTNLSFTGGGNGAEIDIADAATQSVYYDAGLLAPSTNYTYMFAGTVTAATELVALFSAGTSFTVNDATQEAIWLTIIQLT